MLIKRGYSTAEAEDNHLSARELVWSDVQNSAASSSSGFGVGFGVNFGNADTQAGKDVAARYPGTLTPIVNMPAREGDEGTTRATVTPGTLELSDQRQDLASLNRDAGAAHVSVEAYDIARLKARQEGAAALSELLNGRTGDLSVKIGLKDGDPAKAALHAAVGAAVAAVAGTDIGAGAAAGLVSELANGVVSQMLKDHPELTKAQQDAIRQWTATALGAAIGGQAGAAAALDNIKHNYLKHEEQLIREKLKKQIRDCKADSACSEETLADLEHQVAYWDDLDQLRDEEWTSSCQASQTSSACVNATREALQAVGYLPTPGGPNGAAGGSEYNGYRDLEQRLKDGRFGGLSDQELAAAVYGERLETIELLKRYPDALREAYDGYVREGAYTAAFSIAGLLLTILPRKAGGGATGSNSRQWDNWQPPAGYTRNADGTVTHNGSGQLYTPVRDASGNVRFDSRGNPVFNTQSAGSTAQTTLTQPSTSGPVINAPAPSRPPTYRIGDSDGGPGAWTRANESMSDAQRAYQQKITGAPAGTAYNVPDPNVSSGRTSFDGYNPQTNALIDAKCWTCWPNNSLSFSNQSVVDQAFRQQRIAQQTGKIVEWHVPDQAAASRVQNAFATAPQSQRIDPNVVRIVVTPQ